MINDFSWPERPNWIGKQVEVYTVTAHTFTGELVDFEGNWLKLDKGGIQTWFAPAGICTVTLVEK